MNRIVMAAAGAIAVVVVVLIVVFVVLRGGEEDDEEVVSALPVVNTAALVTADAIVLPVQYASLSLQSAGSRQRAGIVAEIPVSKNQFVEKGEVLVRLERAAETAAVEEATSNLTLAEARLARLKATIAKEEEQEDEARPVDIENARIAVRGAREHLLHVSGANLLPGATVTPEGAIKEAERAKSIADAQEAVQDAQEELLKALGVASTDEIPRTPASLANKVARDMALADARIAILDAQEDLEDAEDFEELLNDAVNDVNAATKNLESAKRDLDAARVNSRESIRKANEVFDDAEEDLRDVYKKWLGISLNEEELNQSPEALFEMWELDLDFAFKRKNLTYANGVAPDDPSTRWNELTLYGWLFLHPAASDIRPTCEDTLNISTSQPCVQRSIEDAWEVFENARDDLEQVQIDGPTAIAGAENAIIEAEQDLQDAEDELAKLQTDRPDLDVAVAKAVLEEAQAELEDLEDFPDPVEVDLTEARLADAEATLDDLLDWPDPLQVALAKEELAKWELELQKLERGRDPLDVARREAELSEAEAQVAVAKASLEQAQIAFEDMELRAPFSGTVAAIAVSVGEEVSTDTVVVRLADISRWQIETDDLDELGVVNLSEGDKVGVTFDALPSVEMTGTVTQISQFGEEKQGAVTYTATIDLDESDPRLRWNMTASIRKSAEETEVSRLR